jgi:hypothetical protein
MIHRVAPLALSLSVSALLLACNSEEEGGRASKARDKSSKSSEVELEKAKAEAEKAKAEAEKAKAEAEKAKAEAAKASVPSNGGAASEGTPASSGASDSSGTAAGTRSAVPTVAEWNAESREVTVRGSSALNCETKMVREWLRVSCRGTTPERGTATGVRVTRGGGKAEIFTFASGDVASLVFPFVEGTDLEAEFQFTVGGSRKLVSKWPYRSPMPEAKGSF